MPWTYSITKKVSPFVVRPKSVTDRMFGWRILLMRLRFTFEAFDDALVLAEIAVEDLHRVLLFEHRVLDAIDAAHRAHSDAFENAVAIDLVAHQRIRVGLHET